jgi:hypothetical protein
VAEPTRVGVARSINLVVAGSLVVGFVLAVLFVIGPASGATESVVTGSVLVAFGIGWLLLGALSIRFTQRPQRWAFVPAAAMGLVGLGLVVFAPRARRWGFSAGCGRRRS